MASKRTFKVAADKNKQGDLSSQDQRCDVIININ